MSWPNKYLIYSFLMQFFIPCSELNKQSIPSWVPKYPISLLTNYSLFILSFIVAPAICIRCVHRTFKGSIPEFPYLIHHVGESTLMKTKPTYYCIQVIDNHLKSIFEFHTEMLVCKTCVPFLVIDIVIVSLPHFVPPMYLCVQTNLLFPLTLFPHSQLYMIPQSRNGFKVTLKIYSYIQRSRSPELCWIAVGVCLCTIL